MKITASNMQASCSESDRTLARPDGARIAYRIVRGAQPRGLLVLIHGMASNMTRWSEFVARTSLVKSWDVLRLDLRGHGRSLFRGPVDMETWSSDLAAILDAEGHQNAVIAGHCLGANLALRFAADHPDRTRGLILIEPMPREALLGGIRRIQFFAPLIRLLIRCITALNRTGIRRPRIPALDLAELDRRTRAAMEAAGSPRALLSRYAAPCRDLRHLPTAVYLQEALEVGRPYPPLTGFAAPVLALLSTGRFLSDPDITRQILSALPRCRIEFIESQHWIPTEKPDELLRSVEAWCGELESGESTGR